MIFSPDGSRLVTSGGGIAARFWNSTDGNRLLTLPAQYPNFSKTAVFSPDGKLLATGCGSGNVKLWDSASGRELFDLKGHSLQVYGLAFHPNGKVLASACQDQTIKLWDITTGKIIRSWTAHRSHITSIAFHPDGQQIASCSYDGTVKIWRTSEETSSISNSLKSNSTTITSKGWSKDDAPAPAIAPFDAVQAKLHEEAWAKHLRVWRQWVED